MLKNAINKVRFAARRGATMMEYVIVAVLIAVAAVVAVAVFGRTVLREASVVGNAATGQGSRAGTAQVGYQQDTENDIEEARKFPSNLSDAVN